jgi:c-di-GMP-binding flagellar brake protein YcgR
VSDSRSHRRLNDAPLLVAYTIGDDFAAARTETYDVGLGGLAMLSEAELPAGQPLRLELELRGDPRPALQLTGEVRWCRIDPIIGQYRIGVEFTDRTPEQEAQLVGYIDMMHKLRDLGVL